MLSLRTSPTPYSHSSTYEQSTPALDYDDARVPASSSPGNAHHLATPTNSVRFNTVTRSDTTSTSYPSFTKHTDHARRAARDALPYHAETSPAVHALAASTSKAAARSHVNQLDHSLRSGSPGSLNDTIRTQADRLASSPPAHSVSTGAQANALAGHDPRDSPSSHLRQSASFAFKDSLPPLPLVVGAATTQTGAPSARTLQDHLRSAPSASSSREDAHLSSRHDHEMRKAQQLRRWAQEDSSSSSDDGEGGATNRSVKRRNQGRELRINTSGTSQSGLLPSPFETTYKSAPMSAGISPQRSALGSDMMDHFMSKRSHANAQADESPIQSDLPRLSRRRTAPKTLDSANLQTSPPRNNVKHAQADATLSPVPSAINQSVLFSPHVADVLDSELHHLETIAPKMAQGHRYSRTQEMNVHSSDVSRDQSPASSDISASAYMHAPSFCDSSPPLSDRAGIAPGAAMQIAQSGHHGSAAEYMQTALPSSSPLSIHSTSASEYDPASTGRHRVSPGPPSRPGQALQRTKSSSTASTSASAPAELSMNQNARKREPKLKRAETSTGIMSTEGHVKPNYSYAALIGQAIFSVPEQRMSLNDIYTFIMTTYPFYKKEDQGWQNSIRHNLSLNDCFVKTARAHNNPGKGCLWAIAAGCEHQFADGSFVKRGIMASKKAAAKLQQQRVETAPPTRKSRPPRKRARGSSPMAEQVNQDSSPAHSVASSSGYQPQEIAPLPRTATTARQRAKARASAEQIESTPEEDFEVDKEPGPELHQISEPASAPRSELEMPAPPIVSRKRPRPLNADIEPEPQSEAESPQVEQEHESEDSGHSRSRQSSCNRAPFAAITASPPTSVYHRLAGPYHPITFSGASTSRRALALLASPEAGGIMPGGDSESGVANGRRSLEEAGLPPFLPAPHLFPGTASPTKHRRTDSDDSSLLRTIVHTQSPVSSVRGSRGDDASPAGNHADPEKRPFRAHGARHIPAVAALADSHFVTDAYRSPPPARSTRALLRSPAAKGCATPCGQAGTSLWSTPGPRGSVARLWGMSPGEEGPDGLVWGFDDSLEAELERLGDSHNLRQTSSSSNGGTVGNSQSNIDTVIASGGVNAPKLYWQSPRVGLNGHW
ncbi:Forkhead transcription factor [Microbotryomycetes sp. JL201]|nr:Forkhead transcription factor [Microbotryomycetes sp. JL201]